MIKSHATHNLTVIVLERIGLHIPNDLVCKQLRELRCLDDVTFDVTKCIIPKGLHNLRNVKEGHIDRMAFQSSHGVLYEEWMVLIRRKEVGDGCDWIGRGPE